MKYIFFTVCCLFIITTTTSAQYKPKQFAQTKNASKHELSIYSFGGYSPLLYTLSGDGTTKAGIGGGAGLGYTFNINPSIGIVTGIEMNTYATEASFGSVSSNYESGTGTDLFRFSYVLNKYKETQNVTLFSIPISVQYASRGRSIKFYASGGLKLGFPLTAKADISYGYADTDGYFADENVDYEILPKHGFDDNISLPDTKQDIDLAFSIALAFETGIRFTLSDKIGMYTGVYLDYGLNNIQKVNDKQLLEYDSDHSLRYYTVNERPFFYHSMLNTILVDKVNLLSAGLKIRISLNL
jgi:hypothetical protein